MDAHVGDRLVIEGHRIREPRRQGKIIEVRGVEGRPPWVVRWDDGHEVLFFPGPDARIEHLEHAG